MKVPHNPLHRLAMGSPRRRLKTSAQTHCKVYVRPRRRQVQEGADHAPVLLLVHRISVLVRIQRRSGRHGSRQRLGICHVELLEDVLRVLALVYEGAFLALLDLESEEEGEFSHHGHLGLMVSANLATKA